MTSLHLGLGIDAGGTQTRWALADTLGAIVAEGSVAGMTALQLGSEEGRARLRATIAEMAAQITASGRGTPAAICAGVTGLDSREETLCSLLAAPFAIAAQAVSVRSDIEIAYRDLFAPGEGYVVYAGTGSIAAYIDVGGEFHRAGGRGVLLDDGGGGFWIAREALRHIWRREDEAPGSWKDSPMAIEVFNRIGGSDWSFTRQFFYGRERGDIGKLALAVAAVASRDPIAASILRGAGVELARLGQAMLSRFGARQIALAGRASLLHPLIAESMRAALPASADLHQRVSEAHAAAARIAAKAHTE